MLIVDCVQGEAEWHMARRAVPTASEFGHILMPVKLLPSKAQETYIDRLIGDKLSQYYPVNAEHYTNKAIRHGEDTEHEARCWYAMNEEIEVEQVGFCLTDDGRFGCSPDGLVGTAGGLELKCPEQHTHMGWYRKGVLPSKHMCQVHGGLIVCGGLLPVYSSPTPDELIAFYRSIGLAARHVPSSAKWWDFLSYHLGLPPLRVRTEPNDFTQLLADELERFWPKFVTALDQVQGRKACAAPNSPGPSYSDGPASEPF